MAEYRSLDEFAADQGSSDDDREPADLDALVRTYEWTPEATTCTGCGQSTQTFWAADGRRRCPSCKDW